MHIRGLHHIPLISGGSFLFLSNRLLSETKTPIVAPTPFHDVGSVKLMPGAAHGKSLPYCIHPFLGLPLTPDGYKQEASLTQSPRNISRNSNEAE